MTTINLKTNRLEIRPITEDDAKSVFAYRSDPETNRFLSLEPQTVDDVIGFINSSSHAINIVDTWFQLVITLKNSQTIIGDIGLHFLAPDNTQAEIGYTLHKNYRGKGFATEAVSAVIQYVFNTLQKHRIRASVDPNNSVSIVLLERLRFKKEAHFKESLFFKGNWVDDVVYALLAKDWRAKFNTD